MIEDGEDKNIKRSDSSRQRAGIDGSIWCEQGVLLVVPSFQASP